MYSGVFAKNYASRPLSALFSAIAAHGYQSVQFNLSCIGLASLPPELPAHLGTEVAAEAQRHGLKIAALSGTYNMAHPDQAIRRAARPGFANVIAAAQQMGAPVVTLCSGTRHPDDMWSAHPDNGSTSAWKDLRAELDFALELAAGHGIRLAVEPEPGNLVADAALAVRLLDEVNAPQLGIILDAANLLPPGALSGQHAIMRDAVDRLGAHTVLAHAKDIAADGSVVPPLTGAVDLHLFVRLLQQAGFTGALVAHGFAPQDNTLAAHGMCQLLAAAAGAS